MEETGIGNIHDKTLKIAVAGLGVAAELEGKVGYGEISFDSDRQIAEIASPVGVVVGLIPATHPVATFIFKALIAIKARNAIILSPSRRAQRVSQQVGVMIQRVLARDGRARGPRAVDRRREHARDHDGADEPQTAWVWCWPLAGEPWLKRRIDPVSPPLAWGLETRRR